MWNPKKEAEKAAKKVVDKIVKPAADAAKGSVNWAKEEAKKSVRKVGSEVEKSAKKVGKEVEGGVKKVGSEVESGVKKVGKETEGGVKKVGGEAKDGLVTAGKEIEKTFEERIPKLAEDAVREFATAVSRQGLTKFRNLIRHAHAEMEKIAARRADLVGALDKPGVTFKLGPLTLVWSGFYSRAEGLIGVLDGFVSEPPKFRRGPLIEMVEAIGPDSIDAGISVELAFVVGSNELGIGGELSEIPLELFTELGDVALEKLGVPE